MIDPSTTHEAIAKVASKEKALEPAADGDERELEPDTSLDLTEHQLFYQVQSLEQELQEAKDTHALRLGYAGRIFWLVCAWLLCVAVAVYLSAFAAWGFTLSDQVLIAFITSTTVNVIGLFLVVAKWMFPNSVNHKGDH